MDQVPLRVGLIGCGDIAPAHGRALAEASGARLVACMDVVASSAQSLGEEFGVPFAVKPEDLLGRADMEAVTVATPAFTHADLVEEAARAGKAVLCEKPLAANLSDADRIISAAQRAGVALGTCFPLRYLGVARWTQELVSAGALGNVIGLRLRNLGEKEESYWTGGYSGRTRTDWRKSKERSGGGVIITNLVHHLDLARAITGLEVTRAYCEMDTFATDVEVEDVGIACLRYSNNAVGVVEGASCVPGGSEEPQIVVLGDRGQARFGLWSRKCEVYLAEEAAGLPAREWVVREFQGQGLAQLYDDFAAAVRSGRQPPITGEDGRRALEIVLAIYRSAETGRPVSLPL